MENESQGLAETPKVEPVQPVEPFPASATSPVISPVPEAPKKSNKKLFLIVGIIILVLVLVAGGIGAYFLMKGQSEVSPTPTPVATIVPTASPNPIADWETYTNTKYGFSIRYPLPLEIFSEDRAVVSGPLEGNAVFITTIVNSDTVLPNTDAPFDGFSVYVQSLGELKGASFDDYLSNERDSVVQSPRGLPSAAVKTVKLGENTYSYINSEQNLTRYFIQSPDKQRIIIFSRVNKSAEFLKTFDQILESFEFVEAPYFSEPTTDSKVVSPLTVRGVVPTGWMFEGNVPVKLLDDKRNVITQAPGTEVSPGAWMDEEPDEFISKLTFTTTAKNGYLVVAKDNPSGNPENDEVYEIPVSF